MSARRKFKTPLRIRLYQKARREALYVRGLTQYGTPRQLKKWFWYGHKTPAEKKLIRQQITRRKNIAAGRRYDGKPLVNRHWKELDGLTGYERQLARQATWNRANRAKKRETPLDRAWRDLRATIEVPRLLNFESITCGGMER